MEERKAENAPAKAGLKNFWAKMTPEEGSAEIKTAVSKRKSKS